MLGIAIKSVQVQTTMIHRGTSESDSVHPSFAKLMQRLGETFAVRDVMVPWSSIEYVARREEDAARHIVEEKRYSVVPVSEDGKTFDGVFCTEHPANGERTITTYRPTSVSDHIPASTPLAEAFYLFGCREWYLTLRGNRVSGLITYWAFNSREFRLQLFAGLSRVEELSRDLLASDGCGVSDETGLHLSPKVLGKIRNRFELARRKMGGNRFVDELQFRDVNDALRDHSLWRHFLHQRIGRELSNTEYEKLYSFTALRNDVMHGRILFPAYHEFVRLTGMIDNIGEFISHLDAYSESTHGTRSRPTPLEESSGVTRATDRAHSVGTRASHSDSIRSQPDAEVLSGVFLENPRTP